VDLELSDEQQLLDGALASLFGRHAGPARARAMVGSVDTDLLGVLAKADYLDVAQAGPVEAVLVAERAAAAVACAPIVARVLVGPLAGVGDLPPTVGLVAGPHSLVRYAGSCDAYLVLDGTDGAPARLAAADGVEVEPVASAATYPMGRVRVLRAETLAPGSGDSLRRAWQVGLAVEIASTALAAVELSARHVRDRHQFGRPIGSFQAVQHRLARCYAMAQAGRWLARRGAWRPTDEFVTASAAAFACATAQATYDNTHQVTGAIGMTDEYGLVQWTMRLLALQRELGGARAHSRRVAAARRP
jgi:hypothetical protein